MTGAQEAQPAEAARWDRRLLVARAALARFGVPEDAPLLPVSERENAIFRVDDPGTSQRFALRIHRRGYQTRSSVRSELQWMEALRHSGVETPVPRPGRDGDLVQVLGDPQNGEPFLCDLLSWVEGTPLAESDSSDATAVVGRLCARVHRQAREWKLPRGFQRQRWDEDGMLGARPLWGDYRDFQPLADGERVLLDRASAAVRGRLQRFGKGADRFGLIHADLMPENILLSGGEAYIIDFDDSGFGWFLYDLATLLAYHAGQDSYDERLQAWVDGYRAVEPLDDEHLEELPTLIMARLLVGLGWLHTRRHTDFARAVAALVAERACAFAEEFLSASPEQRT